MENFQEKQEVQWLPIVELFIIHYGFYMLAGVCQKEGFDVEFLDAPAKQMKNEEAFKWIENKNKKFDLIVIDTSTPSIYNDAKFAGDLKDIYKEAFVILVGTHPTALPEETIGLDKRVDGVACGEFDYIIRDLAKTLENKGNLKEVKGLVFKDGEQILKNPAM